MHHIERHDLWVADKVRQFVLVLRADSNTSDDGEEYHMPSKAAHVAPALEIFLLPNLPDSKAHLIVAEKNAGIAPLLFHNTTSNAKILRSLSS